MRNIQEHPITEQELIDFLEGYKVRHSKLFYEGVDPADQPVGDMTPILFDELIYRIRTSAHLFR